MAIQAANCPLEQAYLCLVGGQIMLYMLELHLGGINCHRTFFPTILGLCSEKRNKPVDSAEHEALVAVTKELDTSWIQLWRVSRRISCSGCL